MDRLLLDRKHVLGVLQASKTCIPYPKKQMTASFRWNGKTLVFRATFESVSYTFNEKTEKEDKVDYFEVKGSDTLSARQTVCAIEVPDPPSCVEPWEITVEWDVLFKAVSKIKTKQIELRYQQIDGQNPRPLLFVHSTSALYVRLEGSITPPSFSEPPIANVRVPLKPLYDHYKAFVSIPIRDSGRGAEFEAPSLYVMPDATPPDMLVAVDGHRIHYVQLDRDEMELPDHVAQYGTPQRGAAICFFPSFVKALPKLVQTFGHLLEGDEFFELGILLPPESQFEKQHALVVGLCHPDFDDFIFEVHGVRLEHASYSVVDIRNVIGVGATRESVRVNATEIAGAIKQLAAFSKDVASMTMWQDEGSLLCSLQETNGSDPGAQVCTKVEVDGWFDGALHLSPQYALDALSNVSPEDDTFLLFVDTKGATLRIEDASGTWAHIVMGRRP